MVFNTLEDMIEAFNKLILTPSGKIRYRDTNFKVAYVKYCMANNLPLSAYAERMGMHSTTPYSWRSLLPPAETDPVDQEVNRILAESDEISDNARPHAEFIIAWANGAEIEYLHGDEWIDASGPIWVPSGEYRIKPAIELVDGKWYEIALVPPYHTGAPNRIALYRKADDMFYGYNSSYNQCPISSSMVTVTGNVEVVPV